MSKKQIKSIPCPSCISFALCITNKLHDKDSVDFGMLADCPIFNSWFYQDLTRLKDIRQISSVYNVLGIKWP